MSVKFQQSLSLDLDRFSADPYYWLSLGRPLAPLMESLDHLGQFEPILAGLQEPDRPESALMVISGHRRLQALKALGQRQALVAIVKVPRSELLELALEANRSRGLNQVEKIMAVAAWESEARPFSLGRLSDLFNEPLGPKQLPAYQTAATLPREFLAELCDEPFDLADYIELAQRPLEEARTLSGLWSRFALSRQKRRQVAELISDIARRENLTPHEVMAGPEVQTANALLERSGKPQAGEGLRQALLKRRQPQLRHWQDRREQLLKSLALKAGLQITWDQSLEDPALKLQLNTANLDQFRRQVDLLTKLKDEPAWAALFEPLQVKAPFTPVKS